MTTTQPTTEETITVLRAALRSLELGHVEQAHCDLCHAIENTPPEAIGYGAMIGAANWIHPLEKPNQAKIQIAKALIILDNGRSQERRIWDCKRPALTD